MSALVALLTDFGTRDGYVGALKGALLQACPQALPVDISHEVPAHDVSEGAYCLATAYRCFPAGTVFVAVVDPAVGSARRALALRAGDWCFVGPDNGIFSWVLEDEPRWQARLLVAERLFRRPVSATFHGRDVFAPVAGYLAGGGAFEELGPTLGDPLRLALGCALDRGPQGFEARVLHVDRFGNLITQLRAAELERLTAGAAGGLPVVLAGGRALPLVRTYADVAVGDACALVGSAGRLELAVRCGQAARVLGLGLGDAVQVRPARS